MSRTKELILDHKGYTLTGVVEVELWGGTKAYIHMHPRFIANDKLTHNTFKKAINDGNFGCKAIISAVVDVKDTYGDQYITVMNRSIKLNSKQCFHGTRGIHKSEQVYR